MKEMKVEKTVDTSSYCSPNLDFKYSVALLSPLTYWLYTYGNERPGAAKVAALHLIATTEARLFKREACPPCAVPQHSPTTLCYIGQQVNTLA